MSNSGGDNKQPEEANATTSSFKDRLAKWNERDESTDATTLDIVRIGKSSDFVRLAAKKRYSINRHTSGGPGGRALFKTKRSGDIPEDSVPEPPAEEEQEQTTPVLMKKEYDSPVVVVVVKKTATTHSSSTLLAPVGSKHPLQSARSRLRKTQGTPSSRRLMRPQTIRATPLAELKADYTPPTIPKSAAAEQVIRAALKKNFVFEKLVPAAVDQLIHAFEPTDAYKKGDVIIQQGDQGDFFYVIESGEVTFEVNGNVVGSAKDGASFGELALLYTCPRAATVKAATTTTLWRLEQTVFRYVLQSKARESKAMKYDLLQKIDFFRQMEKSDVQRCVNVMTPRKYEPGEYIVRKGEDGDAFYVVQSGELTVTDISVGETTYDDVALGPGDFFGERALVKNEPRAANVVGFTAGTLFSIDRETFERVCGSFVRLILKSQDKSRLSGLKFVKAAKLDTDTVAELTHYLGDEMYREGKEIFLEGKKTKPALYMVREGQIQVKYSNGEEKIIKEGGYFGEEHLLADAKGILLEDGRIVAKYSATAVEHNSICAILTLRDCRKVFDTKNMELSDELEDEEYSGMAVKEDEEFKGFVGRRSSRRSSVNMDVLRNSLVRTSVLGEGQFGEVWEVETDLAEFSDSSKFALKIQSKKDTSRASCSAIEAIKRECQLLGSMDHPFIVELVHHYEDDENIYMVMGLVRGGDLWGVVHSEQADGEWYSGVPESHAKFYALIIADTLDYMHRRKIVFRDLKLENVMVDEDGYPIIVDFGFAKCLKDGVTYTFCGTPQYLAPEICANTGHGYAVDHWALGCIIYEMIGGENPFYYEGVDNLSLFNDIVNEAPYPLPEDRIASDEARDLIDRLLVKDPTQRIGSMAKGGQEIKTHPWFGGLDLQLAREKKVKAPFLPKL